MKQILIIFLTILIAGNCANRQTTVPLWKTLPETPPMPQADESGLAPVNDIKMYYAVFLPQLVPSVTINVFASVGTNSNNK